MKQTVSSLRLAASSGSPRSLRVRSAGARRSFFVCILLLATPLSAVEGQRSGFRLFPESASEQANQVDQVYFGLLLISSAVIALLLVLIWYSIFRYKSEQTGIGKAIAKSQWKIETAWSVIPFFIFLGLFAWGAGLYLKGYQNPEGAEEVHIVGRQWMWQMYYPDGRMAHNELHIPVDEPTTLTLSSEDVIHSFYVPAFRMKRDVMPGKYVQLTLTPSKAGRYRLYCAEFCGTDHSGMIGWVHVLEPEDYAAWQQSETPRESLAGRGETLFRKHGCSGCHAPESGLHAPDLAGIAGRRIPLANGDFATADSAYLRDSILLPGKQIAAGYENLMPSYSGILSEAKIAALVAYIQSLEPGDLSDD